MRAFLKKDLLVFWRDRKEVWIPLVLPIILIVAMGFLLPNWFENPTSSMELKAAFVVKDDYQKGIKQFQDSLERRGMKAEEATGMEMLANNLQPSKMLQEVFANEEIARMIELIKMDEEEALRRLEAEEIQVIVTIPEDFTLQVLNKILLGEGEGTTLNLVAEDSSMEISTLQGIIDSFTHQLNTGAAIAHAGTSLGTTKSGEIAAEPNIAAVGGVESIEGVRAVTTFQYFTLSISVIFTLFIAASMARKAITEKREQVFQRILLSGSRPLDYLAGKISSTLLITLLQLSLVIVICHFALNVFSGFTLQLWIGFILLTFMLCVFVASMSGLFTALMFRMNMDIAIAIIHTFIMIIGVIGGNFVPVYILPDGIQQLWEWTPNGLWLSTMIQWIQQGSWLTLAQGMLGLSVFTVVTAALSVWLFPKRGRI